MKTGETPVLNVPNHGLTIINEPACTALTYGVVICDPMGRGQARTRLRHWAMARETPLQMPSQTTLMRKTKGSLNG